MVISIISIIYFHVFNCVIKYDMTLYGLQKSNVIIVIIDKLFQILQAPQSELSLITYMCFSFSSWKLSTLICKYF